MLTLGVHIQLTLSKLYIMESLTPYTLVFNHNTMPNTPQCLCGIQIKRGYKIKLAMIECQCTIKRDYRLFKSARVAGTHTNPHLHTTACSDLNS